MLCAAWEYNGFGYERSAALVMAHLKDDLSATNAFSSVGDGFTHFVRYKVSCFLGSAVGRWDNAPRWLRKCLILEFFSYGSTAPTGPRPPRFSGLRDHTPRHTTLGRTPLDE